MSKENVKPPGSWSVKPLSEIAEVIVSNVDKKLIPGEHPVRLCNYIDVYNNENITPDLSFMEATASQAEIAKFRLRSGDVIITKDSETPNDIGVPSVVRADIDQLVCGYHLSIIRLKSQDNDPVFLARQINSPRIASYFGRQANGTTRYGLGIDSVGDTEIWLATPDEQRRIALILDTVDEAIAKTEALIAKLKLVMTGLLRDLLTLGVDDNGELRRLKEVPRSLRLERSVKLPVGWEMKTLNDVGDWHAGGTPRKQTKSFWGGTIPWLTPKDMKIFRIKRTTDYVTELGASCGTRMVPPESIFIVVRGMILAHTFPVCISEESFTFNQDIRALTANGKASMPYLAFWFIANQQRMLGITSEATHGTKRIDMAELRKVEIALPSRNEQNEIVRRLKEHENRIDREVLFLKKMRVFKSGLANDLLAGRKLVLSNLVAIR